MVILMQILMVTRRGIISKRHVSKLLRTTTITRFRKPSKSSIKSTASEGSILKTHQMLICNQGMKSLTGLKPKSTGCIRNFRREFFTVRDMPITYRTKAK